MQRIQEFIRAVNDCEYELELITKKKRKLEVPCKTTNEYIAKLREENEELRQKYQIAKTELENHEDEYLQLCQAEDNFIALCLDLNRKIDQKNAREDKTAHEMRLLSEAEDYKRKMFMYISRHYHIEPTEESAIGLLNVSQQCFVVGVLVCNLQFMFFVTLFVLTFDCLFVDLFLSFYSFVFFLLFYFLLYYV